jgi:DNA-directed RNA polymerase subunit RPC12/RpoP
MSEFKFACPVCGQHIKCESNQTGTQLECPTCFQKVIVPQAPSDTSKFVLTAAQPQTRPAPQPSVPTAPASQPPPASGLSTAAAIALVLICAAAGAFVAFRGKIFGPVSKLVAVTNAPPSATNTAAGQPGALQVSQGVNGNSSDLWTLDLTNAVLPARAAAGVIHGTSFACDLAVLQNGALTLRAGTFGAPYVGLTINLFAQKSVELAGKLLNVTTNDPIAPRVVLRWVDDQQPVTEIVRGGYAMKLELGKVANGRIPGTICICLPDDAKSYVAGTFQVEIRDLPPPKKPSSKSGRPNQPKQPR